MLQLCTKSDPSHGSAHQSLGETTRAAAPSRALEGRSVTSLPLVRGGGRGADQAGEGLLPTPMPFLQDVLGFSELCVFARLAAAGAGFPWFPPLCKMSSLWGPTLPTPQPSRKQQPPFSLRPACGSVTQRPQLSSGEWDPAILRPFGPTRTARVVWRGSDLELHCRDGVEDRGV